MFIFVEIAILKGNKSNSEMKQSLKLRIAKEVIFFFVTLLIIVLVWVIKSFFNEYTSLNFYHIVIGTLIIAYPIRFLIMLLIWSIKTLKEPENSTTK